MCNRCFLQNGPLDSFHHGNPCIRMLLALVHKLMEPLCPDLASLFHYEAIHAEERSSYESVQGKNLVTTPCWEEVQLRCIKGRCDISE